MINTKFKAFLMTADVGSFTKAAEILNYSPSGVSQLVSSLEKEFGFPLLIRTRRGVILTKEGEAILPVIRESLKQEERLTEMISAFNGLYVGNINIGTYTSIASIWLPGIVKKFLKKYPGIDIKIIEGIHEDLEEKLDNRTLDLCFFSYRKQMHYDWLPLARDELLVVLPKDHPKAQHKYYDYKDLPKEDFIMPHLGRDYDLLYLLNRFKVTPNITMTTLNNFAMLSMVSEGMGVSIINELASRNFLVDLEMLPFDPPQYITLGIAVPSLENAAPAVRSFINFASEYLIEKTES